VSQAQDSSCVGRHVSVALARTTWFRPEPRWAADDGAVGGRALADHLENRRVLLVLDQCEHLADTCAVLPDALLRGCPGRRILATS